jgi:hypothetical protein
MRTRETRHKVLVPARLRLQGGWADAKIRNVSTRGMLLHTSDALPRGTYLEIARGQLRWTGCVMWSRDGLCGVRTRERIDLGLLTGAAATARQTDEPQRPLSAAARIRPVRDRQPAGGRVFEFAATCAIAAAIALGVAGTAYAQFAQTVGQVRASL